jgi:hypothetical protein
VFRKGIVRQILCTPSSYLAKTNLRILTRITRGITRRRGKLLRPILPSARHPGAAKSYINLPKFDVIVMKRK